MEEIVYIHFSELLYCFQFRARIGVDHLSLCLRPALIVARLLMVVLGCKETSVPTFPLPTLTLLVTAQECKVKVFLALRNLKKLDLGHRGLSRKGPLM